MSRPLSSLTQPTRARAPTQWDGPARHTRPARCCGPSLLLLALVVSLASLVAACAGSSDPLERLASPYGYSLARWEFRHVLNKWLYDVGGLFRHRPSGRQEQDRVLRDYFRATADLGLLNRRLAAGESVREELARLEAQQRALENRAEAVIEGRVGAVLKDLGLARCLPLLGRPCALFPPVDIEFDNPPHVLVISPRQRIELERPFLLRQEMSTEEVLELERQADGLGVSSLVVDLGGVATYPSIVPPSVDYGEALEVAAHEWLHQYLFFDPLGRHYFGSEAMRSINETVANIAGREIAALAKERFPIEQAKPAQGAPPAPGAGGDLLRRELRALRLAVEEMLAAGNVDEAEALMEKKRQELAEKGFYIRRINQAYFAWHGLYADSPASVSPIGPKVEELRRHSSSLKEFLRSAARISQPEGLDRLLGRSP